MPFSDLPQSDQDAILAATLLMRPLAGGCEDGVFQQDAWRRKEVVAGGC